MDSPHLAKDLPVRVLATASEAGDIEPKRQRLRSGPGVVSFSSSEPARGLVFPFSLWPEAFIKVPRHL